MPELFLIVDDDNDSAYLAQRNLETTFPKATFERADSGITALNTLKEKTFTAIITDYRMPRMDGLMMTRQIRERKIRTPIIMRTAMENLADAAQAAGVDYVLPWFKWKDLGEVVKKILGGTKAV